MSSSQKVAIRIGEFIKVLADMTLKTSVISDSSGLENKLEEVGLASLEKAGITELLIAQIFVDQIPINKFLVAKKRSYLLDSYFKEIYSLLIGNFRYFQHKQELMLFETLIQARFREFYETLDESGVNYVSLGREVAKNLASKKLSSPLLCLALGVSLRSRETTMQGFLEETSAKFEIIY